MVNIAVLGYGTVAKGAIEALQKKNKDSINIKKILVRRDIPEIADISTKDFEDVLKDKEISVVVELIGGDEPAFTYVKKSLEAGKSVVSANKLMLSKHYAELAAVVKSADGAGSAMDAASGGVNAKPCLAFSAAAGGGIPWLTNLKRFCAMDKALSLSGIMNGTTNYILDEMTSKGADFADVLKEAQRLGYAEADPTADIDGLDVKAKLALSVDIAAGGVINPDSIPAFGIRYITKKDIDYFSSKGLVCKLLGRAELGAEGISAYVEPVLLPAEAPEAGVKGAGNIISAVFENAGKMSFMGAGAGGGPTGNAVAMDVLDVINSRSIFAVTESEELGALENATGNAVHRYYLSIDGSSEITAPVSVKEMHSKVQDLIKSGKAVFAAAMEESC